MRRVQSEATLARAGEEDGEKMVELEEYRNFSKDDKA
jgi:hypothetical protein